MLVPAFAIILLFQLVGEVISRALHLPLPGPVLGMVGMVMAISALPKVGEIVTPVAQGLLRYLALMFVPVGVGIVSSLQTIEAHWLAISASLLLSTVAAIALAALTFVWVSRLTGSHGDE